MKKNFAMWFVTFCVAIFGFVIAIIAFFKKKHFFWHFKNEKDILDDLDVDNEEDVDSDAEILESELSDLDDDSKLESVDGKKPEDVVD